MKIRYHKLTSVMHADEVCHGGEVDILQGDGHLASFLHRESLNGDITLKSRNPTDRNIYFHRDICQRVGKSGSSNPRKYEQDGAQTKSRSHNECERERMQTSTNKTNKEEKKAHECQISIKFSSEAKVFINFPFSLYAKCVC